MLTCDHRDCQDGLEEEPHDEDSIGDGHYIEQHQLGYQVVMFAIDRIFSGANSARKFICLVEGVRARERGESECVKTLLRCREQ